MFAAFGSAYHGGWLFPLLVIGVFVPFLVVPAVIGSALTLILVNVFPARRTRDILSVIAVLAAGGIVLLFRIVRPERLARPRDSARWWSSSRCCGRRRRRSCRASGCSARCCRGCSDRPRLLPVYLLWTTAAAAFVLGALLHSQLYRSASARRRRAASAGPRAGVMHRVGHRLLAPLGILRRELVLKELRLFFRDTTQWSQLILLAELVVVYVFNIKYLPLRGEGVTFFLVNVIPFLNLVLAGFVAGVDCRTIHLSEREPGRAHVVALTVEPNARARSLVGEILGRHDAAAAAGARDRGRDERAAPR
jgi:ABC-2 type transport system permease protein